MTNILTASEASIVLRCETTDADMLGLLPLVDAHIINATGHNWTADSPIRPEAKEAARMLLVMWHEDPGRMAAGSALGFGLTSALVQLESIALCYAAFEGRDGAGSIDLTKAHLGDTVTNLVGLVGSTGDQHTLFETLITVEGEIQQVSALDLTGKYYRAFLTPMEGL